MEPVKAETLPTTEASQHLKQSISEEQEHTLWEKVTEGISHFFHTASGRFRTHSTTAGANNIILAAHDDNTLLTRLTARTGIDLGLGNGRNRDSGPVRLLGIEYPSCADQGFQDDFKSRVWITYRNGYPPIKPSTYTSDVGWGCMLRSGQMMLANAFLFHELGRDWRLTRCQDDKGAWDKYVTILNRFLDTPSAPFSIHRIALLGKQFDKNIGEWFGPSTISHVLKVLLDDHKDIDMGIYVATDGVMYLDDINNECTKGHEGWRGTLILVPIRLGVEGLNPVYFDALKACFSLPQCVGIAGGRPNSSLFFIGVEGNHLVYLDPHFLRPAVEVKHPASYAPEDLSTYHCETVRTMSMEAVDPSLVLGFYCSSKQDLKSFCEQAVNISHGRTPLFTIQEKAPEFQDRDGDVLSDGDDF
ncbi:cysteine protease ATG4 [Spizellomyces punctatus DAOM BR117]|uniref:Cysteine protease n=1 Tax=Spizellomyces punctatus (strain DAOM BR117) TaxID=645134 RepID=A0A0L0H7Z4_SPIPD|nr:cysteine protease ATG4 [Spizellomyces punctatus DAOM BR117]KNC97056.1 hypothetical protein SPPG_07453 [Spizellomyces punctatus DAOM BR117]|eukprot:XP_016605096.1 hypothetical protein SPPG_07453 [Spizellomyces punctatus DAOM BR117]